MRKLLLMVLLLCEVVSGAAEEKNLIRNGGFEELSADKFPQYWYVLDEGGKNGDNWRKHTIQVGCDPNIVRSGSYSGTLQHSASDYGRWVMLRQDLKLPSGEYVIAGYVTWRGKSFARPCVALHLIDGDGGVDHPLVLQLWNKNTPDDWVYFWKKFTVSDKVRTVGVNILATDGPVQAYVDDVGVYRLEDAPPPPEEAVQTPVTIPAAAGHPKVTGLEKSEHFGLFKNEDGVWYLTSPEGEGFFDLGVNHCSYPVKNSWWDQMDPVRGEAVRSRWPERADWNEWATTQLKKWGFSSLGAWSFVDLYGTAGRKGLGHWTICDLNNAGSGRYLLKSPTGAVVPVGGTSRMADPFDPEWREEAAQQIAGVIAGEKEFGRERIGIFPENEISLGVVPLYAYSWTPAARRAMAGWLEKKYGSIDALNQAWSSDGHKFEWKDFAAVVASPPDLAQMQNHGAFLKDMEAFEDFLVETYVKTVIDLIRKQDPDALICSPRLPGERLCDYAPLRHFRHFDIIAVNSYGGRNYSDRQLRDLKKIHEVTGRPILITEWTVSGTDENEQAERARIYMDMVKQLSNLPFVIGMHWQMWFRPTASGGNNYGLIDRSEEPYPEFSDVIGTFQTESFRK